MKRTGQLFKESRERQKISISEVSLATKINPKVITHMETGDLNELPASTFLRGFVRTYAKFLNLDINLVMSTFNEEMGSPLQVKMVEPPQKDETPEVLKKLSKIPFLNDLSITSKSLAVAGILALIFIIVGVKGVVDRYEEERIVAPPPEGITSLDLEKEKPEVETTLETTETADEKKPEADTSQEKVIADKKSEEDNLAAEKLTAERLALEKKAKEEMLAAEKKAKEEKLEAEKLAAEKKAKEEKLEAEKLAAEKKAKEEKLAAEKRAAEKKAKEEKLEAEKLAAEKKAKEEKLAAEKRAAEKRAAEKKAKEEKLAAENKAKKEKRAAEKKASVEKPALAASKQEVIIEAFDNVIVHFRIDGGKLERMRLEADQVHTIKAKSQLAIDVSDGGSVSIVHNGRDRGVPGDLGKPVKVRFP